MLTNHLRLRKCSRVSHKHSVPGSVQDIGHTQAYKTTILFTTVRVLSSSLEDLNEYSEGHEQHLELFFPNISASRTSTPLSIVFLTIIDDRFCAPLAVVSWDTYHLNLYVRVNDLYKK